jgi:hypothetical protein
MDLRFHRTASPPVTPLGRGVGSVVRPAVLLHRAEERDQCLGNGLGCDNDEAGLLDGTVAGTDGVRSEVADARQLRSRTGALIRAVDTRSVAWGRRRAWMPAPSAAATARRSRTVRSSPHSGQSVRRCSRRSDGNGRHGPHCTSLPSECRHDGDQSATWTDPPMLSTKRGCLLLVARGHVVRAVGGQPSRAPARQSR